MKYYKSLYERLCHTRKSKRVLDEDGNAIHKHHITPRHSGGLDIEENLAYLTIREHIIAHFLLWKIFKNPNDLRSMHMLGARLTKTQRRITGEYCRDNNIGFFGYDKSSRADWRRRGALRQVREGLGIHTKDDSRQRWASMGGKFGSATQIREKLGIHADDGARREWASLGGKSHVGKIWMNNGIKNERVPEEEFEDWLSRGWKKGLLTKRWKSR